VLYLLIKAGGERFALEAHHVAEVLPMIALTPVPNAACGVAGMANYRGTAVPVVDLAALVAGRPARSMLSTRLLIARLPDDSGAGLCGIVAEQATDLMRRDRADFQPTGLSNDGAPFLGAVTIEADQLVQVIDVGALARLVLGASAESAAIA